MREAMGGTWLFGIVILFIALFTSFLAYSISYTRAFNTKNEIINILERNEGFSTRSTSTCDESDDSVECMIEERIDALGYNDDVTENISCNKYGAPQGSTETAKDGYCIVRICEDGVDNAVHYKVTTFIAIKIPVINVTVSIPVSGETKTIYYDRNNSNVDMCNSVNGVSFKDS